MRCSASTLHITSSASYVCAQLDTAALLLLLLLLL
jgi:hypothetical protein